MVLRYPGKTLTLVLATLVLLGASATGLAAARYTLKFATLAPKGTAPMNILEEWGREVAARSDGRLTINFYPGGIQGDEPEVLKKIRFGQLQGGAFTGYGIGRIYSPARVLEFPFLFQNYEEIDQVRAHYMPEFEHGFHHRGYELLGWMEMGFIRFFSKRPVRSIEDLRQRRIWLWQGDPLGEAWFRAANISPVPLSITDVYTSLSTGLIDTVYATPLVAMALQWSTKTAYMTDVPMANGIGALVVSRRFLERLPHDLRLLLSQTGKATGERLTAVTRDDNRKSIDALEREGVRSLLTLEDIDPAQIRLFSERAASELAASDYIPRSLFERTRILLREIRRRTPRT